MTVFLQEQEWEEILLELSTMIFSLMLENTFLKFMDEVVN
jgi:hypothetical protein